MIRVLVVDDSAFARKVLREALSAYDDIEVIDIARDGLEALEKIQALRPDVVTLDLMMPNLDGLGVLRALPVEGRPRVVVVSTSDSESELSVEALQLGAVTVVHKPTALATERLYAVSGELVRAVRLSMGARPLGAVEVSPPPALVAAQASRVELVVVGASTGGPQALTHLLAALPKSFPVPVALVLHIPPEYTAPFAARLDGVCALEVREAEEGLPLLPGRVVVARGGVHLTVARSGAGQGLTARLETWPPTTAHRPAIDVLFGSAAEICGEKTLGVVLTGMGDDGTAGARAIRAVGGRMVTEAEESCVVYGMPRSVVEAGLSNGSAPLSELPALIMRLLDE
jgi:two-component system chemotaxis response regulator CheB